MRVLCALVVCLLAVPASARAQTPTFIPTSYESIAGARAIVSADLNGDGWTDIASANTGRNSVAVLLSRGRAGGFLAAQEIPVGRGPFDLDAGDFDRDGVIDLLVTTPDANAIEVLMLRRTGALRSRLVLGGAGHSRGARFADVTGDGWLDIVYSDFVRNFVVVVPNTGAGGVFSDLGTLPVPAAPQGVATGDFNRDGRMDAAVVSTGSTSLTILEGVATAAPVRRSVSAGVTLNVLTAVDINGDGWLDLAAVSTNSNRLVLFRGGSTGFAVASVASTGNSPRGLTTNDVNADGRPDVLVANRSSSSLSLFLGRSNGSFSLTSIGQLPAGTGARAVAAADFNNDSRVDMVSGNETAAAVTVFDNDTALVRAAFSLRREPVGDGVFGLGGGDTVIGDFNEDGRPDFINGPRVLISGTTPVPFALRPSTSVQATGAADMNRDGHLDAVLLVDSRDPITGAAWTGVEIHTGDGRGGFAVQSRVQAGRLARDMRLGDINRDGLTDIVVADFSNRLIIVRQLGGGSYGVFTAGLPAIPTRLELADVNRDGILDAVATASFESAVMISAGDGSGFGPATMFHTETGSGDVGAGDLDHDGRIDLVVTSGGRVGVMRGGGDGTFTTPEWFGDSVLTGHAVVADFTQDGHLDVFVSDGRLFPGRGDGTLDPAQAFATEIFGMVASDWNHDGLPDIVSHDQALLNERRSVNRPPVAIGQDRVMTYLTQWGVEEPSLTAFGSEDPDLHALTYEWRDERGQVMNVSGFPFGLFTPRRPPGTYRFSVVVKDGRGGQASDEIVVEITPSKEIVMYASNSFSEEGWRNVGDDTAAGGVRIHYPDAGAPKVNAPLAAPVHYRDIFFTPDPTQTYKLWVRLKADRNSYSNDSIWVQFTGAVDAAGTPAAPVGTTQGLAVNLEECSGCGLSGWGWEDDGWGGRNVNGMLLRFPEGGVQHVRIQVREDGVSVDQIVLSAEHYLTSRPGTAKDDTTLLPSTQED